MTRLIFFISSPATTHPSKLIKKRIQFVEPIRSAEPGLQQTKAKKSTEFGSDLITDICATLCQTQDMSPGSSMGFLTDGDPFKHRHHLYHPKNGKRSSDTHNLSLESLLSSKPLHPKAFALTRRDRLYLAVTLASSILQLDTTMWFNRR